MCVAILASCGRDGAAGTGPKRPAPVVCTTFYPTTYFAERLAPAGVAVRCPAPADADPVHWHPARDAILEFQGADLVVLNGAGLEAWLQTVSLPESRLVDTTAPIRDKLVRTKRSVHSHGPRGAHSHAGTDPHTWLDPMNAQAQAAEIARAMLERWGAHAPGIRVSLDKLHADLGTLDARLAGLAPRAREAVIIASHPAYDYLARRYDIPIVNVEIDGQAGPDEAYAAVSAALAARPNAICRIMLWESSPPASTQAGLYERFGVRSVVFSPCEATPAEGEDFMSVMHANISGLESALAPN